MKARVYVTLKAGVLDPQGQAIEGSLNDLGYGNAVRSVRQGKVFDVELADTLNQDDTEKTLRKVCETLLANTVIEDFRFEILS